MKNNQIMNNLFHLYKKKKNNFYIFSILNKKLINKISDIYKNKNKEKISKTEFNIKLKAYFKSQILKDYLTIILASLLSMISYDYFISATTNNGITQSGIGAIARGIVISIWKNYDLTIQNGIYWIIYFIINLPLFIFSLFQVSHRFAFRTIIYIILQNSFHFIFAYIPFINPTEFCFIVNYKNLILYYNSNGMYQIWLFIYAIIAGILNGIAFGLLYKSGSSAGGTDFIVAYYSMKKKRSIAKYNRLINYFIVIIMIIVHIILIDNKELTNIFFGINWKNYYNTIIKNNNQLNTMNFNYHSGLTNEIILIYKIKYFCGPILFATYTYIIVQSIITDIIFPKFKYRSLMIITQNSNKIITGLQYIKYSNNIIRIPIQNILLGEETHQEIIICPTSLLEYKNVKAVILVSDSKAIILSYKLDKIIGHFFISQY